MLCQGQLGKKVLYPFVCNIPVLWPGFPSKRCSMILNLDYFGGGFLVIFLTVTLSFHRNLSKLRLVLATLQGTLHNPDLNLFH